MKIKSAASTKAFNIVGYIYITLLALYCAIPFVLVLSGSFSDESTIVKHGFKLIPEKFSVSAYKTIFMLPDRIFNAYKVTLMVTIIGTCAGLFMIAMAGYVLSRKDLKYRNQISFFIYFTTLFGGGLIPWYILITKYLGLKDSYLALILPSLMSPFLIILMRSFMKSIPEEIVESAKVDGAGDFTIFLKLILPLAKPALATIGLFLALDYWNNWFNSSIFITDQNKFSLQYLLYNILQSAEFLRSGAASNVSATMVIPSETLKLATAVIATGPVILFYPFVQKYFVQGLTLGAVKG
jgi:putative aldouronate transport system permease protein